MTVGGRARLRSAGLGGLTDQRLVRVDGARAPCSPARQARESPHWWVGWRACVCGPRRCICVAGRRLVHRSRFLRFRSIAAALARAVPQAYAEAVIRRQPSAWRSAAAKANADAATQARLAVLDSADAYAAYEHAFRDPLSALAAAGELGRGVVVAIDGLDEAGIVVTN